MDNRSETAALTSGTGNHCRNCENSKTLSVSFRQSYFSRFYTRVPFRSRAKSFGMGSRPYWSCACCYCQRRWFSSRIKATVPSAICPWRRQHHRQQLASLSIRPNKTIHVSAPMDVAKRVESVAKKKQRARSSHLPSKLLVIINKSSWWTWRPIWMPRAATGCTSAWRRVWCPIWRSNNTVMCKY